MNELRSKNPPLAYRRCVGIVVFNQNYKVWLGHRVRIFEQSGALTSSREAHEGDDAQADERLWQFPQGGIDKCERPIEAAYRELFEETGMKSVKKLGKIEGWLHYDLPEELVGVALKGKYRGQKQKWFALQFLGNDSEITINPPPGNNPVEFDAWKWEDIDAVYHQVVPFKQAVYRKVIEDFRRFIII